MRILVTHLTRMKSPYICAAGLETSKNQGITRKRIRPVNGQLNREIRLNSILIPPLATYGRGFSVYLGTMLPWDPTIMGAAHSHPSGNPHPSIHDLNHFRGRIMVIAAYPYNDYTNLAVYDREGSTIPHEIVPDETPQQL